MRKGGQYATASMYYNGLKNSVRKWMRNEESNIHQKLSRCTDHDRQVQKGLRAKKEVQKVPNKKPPANRYQQFLLEFFHEFKGATIREVSRAWKELPTTWKAEKDISEIIDYLRDKRQFHLND